MESIAFLKAWLRLKNEKYKVLCMVEQNLLQTKLPLIAILRGIKTDEAIQYVSKLIELGYFFIEVPLNSPNALETIRLLHEKFGQRCLIGAGTVTDEMQLKQVLDIGIKLIVTPNVNSKVITLAKQNNCCLFVGVMTPSEAFEAIHYGATLLKIYPSDVIGCHGFKAIKTVLPPSVSCFPVGGINADYKVMEKYLQFGASGFGIGSALYSPGIVLDEFVERASAFKTSYELAKSS